MLVGADIGGTFTDVIAVGDGRLTVRKVLSTPDDYSRAVVDGVEQVLASPTGAPGELERLLHATTVATNAVLEARGSRAALITTAGFRDVLEIGRLRRPGIYDLSWRKPPPLIGRELRREANERIDAGGRILLPLDHAQVERVVEELVAQGVESIAVCLINSHLNPVHEKAIGGIVTRIAPHLFLSLSSDILPRAREYERTSTTVVNAYIGPVVARYLGALEDRVARDHGSVPVLLMQSNGGLAPARTAARRPAALVESGPAAGALAAAVLARLLGTDLIGLDVGGTTAKACVIEDGRAREAQELEVGAEINVQSRLLRGGGYVISLPAIDLAEVGAGGGSIAHVDSGGGLKVGPRSAGAAPGPVCYGLGGTEPTVTDAFAALGFLGSRGIAGGSREIDVDATLGVIRDRIAGPLGLTVNEAAWGIYQVASATMIRAVRAVTTERGRDPRTLTMAAFGGAGPVHAANLALQMGLERVVIPLFPGVFSSLGLLLAEMRFDLVRPVIRRAGEITDSELRACCADLQGRGEAELLRIGIEPSAARSEWVLEMRYDRQGTELAVRASPEIPILEMVERFEREHERTYGHRSQGEVVSIRNLHLRLHVLASTTRYEDIARMAPVIPGPRAEPDRSIYFGREFGKVTTPVLGRSDLAGPVPGPFIVAEYDTNVVVAPGFTGVLDQYRNIVLSGRR